MVIRTIVVLARKRQKMIIFTIFFIKIHKKIAYGLFFDWKNEVVLPPLLAPGCWYILFGGPPVKLFCVWINNDGFLVLTNDENSFILFCKNINLALTELYLKVIASLITSSGEVSNSIETSSTYLYSRFWIKSYFPLPSFCNWSIAKYL